MADADAPIPVETAAALVLGARVRPDGSPSEALRRRALAAVALYRAGKVTKIVASGGPPGACPTEAEAIAAICREAGVPEGDLVLEPRATSTEENIRLSLPLLRRHGIAALWLVTDRFHAPRARLTARACGLEPRLFCPPTSGAGPLQRLRAWARELPALALYAWRLRRRR